VSSKGFGDEHHEPCIGCHEPCIRHLALYIGHHLKLNSRDSKGFGR